MHNIRAKLAVVALVLFVCGLLFPASYYEQSKPNTDTESTDKPVTSAEPINEELLSNTETQTILSEQKTRYVAHRGYSAAAPENTSIAFELAGKSAFWGIETDIQETSDGVFVCMHDDTIDRTTDGSGTISEYSYGAVSELSITSGANIDKYPYLSIPTMQEYLEICKTYNCVPIIEIKHITNHEGFLKLITDNGLHDKCIVTGQIEDLTKIREIDDTIFLMLIGYSNIEPQKYKELLDTITGNKGILYNYPAVTQDVVTMFHNDNTYIGVWSLETYEEAEVYFDYGADYVVTNEIPGRDDLMINTNE